MSHLGDEQLSAKLDGMLAPDADAAAERHLASCAECRERLAALAALDRDLAGALAHEPGEAYFADFERRVQARIALAESPAPSPRRSPFAWWNSPRALAWAGAAASLVVVAALAVTLMRGHAPQSALEGARSSELGADAAPRAAAPATPAPAAGRADQLVPVPAAPPRPEAQRDVDVAPAPAAHSLAAAPRVRREAEAADRPAPAAKALAPAFAPAPSAPGAGNVNSATRDMAPQHALPVRTLPNGEQVAGAAPLAAPQAQLEALQGAPGAAHKRLAQPLGGAASFGNGVAESAVAGRAAVAPYESGSLAAKTEVAPGAAPVHLCGDVRDQRGRPVAGASVFVVETGASARAGADGAWCLDVSAPRATFEVLALGYRAYTGVVGAGDAGRTVAIRLHAVDALAPSVTFTGARVNAAAATRAWDDAAAASALAGRDGSAAAWSQAGERWETAASVAASADRPSALFRAADARVRAWRLAPGADTREAARGATTAYLKLAPAGPLRDLALGWQRELAP